MADKRGTGRPIPPVFPPCCLPSGRWRWKIGSRGTIDACCESRWKIAPGILRPRSHANGCARAFFLSGTLRWRGKKGHRRSYGPPPRTGFQEVFLLRNTPFLESRKCIYSYQCGFFCIEYVVSLYVFCWNFFLAYFFFKIKLESTKFVREIH